MSDKPISDTPRTDIDIPKACMHTEHCRILRRELNECRNDFSALQRAIVGETGLSAILEATRLRSELARALRVVEAVESTMCIEFPQELRDAIQRWWDEEAGR